MIRNDGLWHDYVYRLVTVYGLWVVMVYGLWFDYGLWIMRFAWLWHDLWIKVWLGLAMVFGKLKSYGYGYNSVRLYLDGMSCLVLPPCGSLNVIGFLLGLKVQNGSVSNAKRYWLRKW